MKTEFFTDSSNLTHDVVNTICENHYGLFSQLTSNDLKSLFLSLDDDPKAHNVFHCMRQNGLTNFIDMVHQFIMCNFGALDHVPDVDSDNHFHYEYVNCGCKHQGCRFRKVYCVIKTKAQA